MHIDRAGHFLPHFLTVLAITFFGASVQFLGRLHFRAPDVENLARLVKPIQTVSLKIMEVVFLTLSFFLFSPALSFQIRVGMNNGTVLAIIMRLLGSLL